MTTRVTFRFRSGTEQVADVPGPRVPGGTIETAASVLGLEPEDLDRAVEIEEEEIDDPSPPAAPIRVEKLEPVEPDPTEPSSSEIWRATETADDGEARTELRVYPERISDETIRSEWTDPDGRSCDCGVCRQGGDCCGRFVLGFVRIERLAGLTVASRTSYRNV